MSWKTFRDNLVSFGNNPDNISDIDKVAKKWADEYHNAILSGGDTINKIKIQKGNKEIMEQLFKAALQKRLSSTAPYDLVGEMGKGVIAYWQGAIMQNVPIPIQLPPGATANISITSNVVLNPGQWTPPAPGTALPDFGDEPTELDIANDIDMPSAENLASDYPVTEEEVTLISQEFGDLPAELESVGFPPLPTAEAELIENPEVIDYDAGLPAPGQPFDPTENLKNEEEIKVESEFKAVLVGGLDYREGDKNIDQQEQLFKQGFGDVKIKAYRYNTNADTVLKFLAEYPKLPIFLFSGGCTLSQQLSKSNLVDNTNLFIIEPYAESANTKTNVETAIKNGVPATNVYVGPTSFRGNGIAGASKTPNGIDHWGALKYVGSQKASLSKQVFYKAQNKQPTKKDETPTIYSNVGVTAAGTPPGYEKFVTDRSKTQRKGANKPDGPNGGIPYENMRKVNRTYGSGFLHPEAAVALELFLDVCAENGVVFEITPGGGWYRDYENQVRLWNDLPRGQAAVPGHSNHGWGIAIDIRTLYAQVSGAAANLGTGMTAAEPNAKVRTGALYKFFAANAPKFGWYNPAALCDNSKTDEAWHWEYHGFKTLSTAQRNQMIATFNSTPRKNPPTKKK